MKQYLDIKYLKIAIYTLAVIVLSILATKIFSNTDNILPTIYAIFKSLTNILSPIIYGLLIAYLMNPCVGFFERHLIKYTKPKSVNQFRHIRILSIVLVYICLFGTLILTIKFLIPQILENVKVLMTNFPLYLKKVELWILYLEEYLSTQFSDPATINIFNKFTNSLNFSNLFNPNILNDMINTIISSTLSITGVLLNWVIGFVIALYALMQKETFTNGSKRFVYSIFRFSTANKILLIFSESHLMITRFFVGKSLDSLIIGIMCFVGLSIADNPYALLLSLMIGIFNMIPYFGPVIGAIPAIILTLFIDLGAAIGVGLFILALQQFDGLVLGPKILGDSIGITPFWIISAITIGGALWGPLGMFFASPILAVLLNMSNRWIDRRLEERAINLPKLSPHQIIPSAQSPQTSISLFSKEKSK